MKIICVEGIVISDTNYSESSKIINVYTKELGIIGIIAKGSRKLRSKLRSSSEKLILSKFNIYYKENALAILISVDVINSYLEIRKDFNKITEATYIIDLTTQVYKQSSSTELYPLLKNSLELINNNIRADVITNILEIKYLEYLGIAPQMEGCTVCGDEHIKNISVTNGGYVCEKCSSNEYIYDTKTIKLIKLFYMVDLKNVTKIDISEHIKKEIDKFINEYYMMYAGLYLKAKKNAFSFENKIL